MLSSEIFIKNIKVANFKSFQESELSLGKFNVIIGANASGKSNFLQIFNFLKDIRDHGLDSAISLQGGAEYLTNIIIGNKKDLLIEITFGVPSNSVILGNFCGKISEINYKFTLKFNNRGGYKISKDRLKLCTIIQKDSQDKFGVVTIENVNGLLKTKFDFPDTIEIKNNDFIPPYLKREKIPANELLINSYLLYAVIPIWGSITDHFSIYDFDSKLPKKAIPFTGKSELESDGSNTAFVLKNIMRNPDTKRSFLNFVKELLPFIDTIKIENFSDKSLFFTIKEKYLKNHFIPSPFLSDGTIGIVSLILALYFAKNKLAIIENPEIHIHPSLLSDFVYMIKDASWNKQILITTHSPEIVNHAGLENIVTILRDDQGFSKIEYPKNHKVVLTFLENDLSLSDLYINNLLTA